MANGKVQLNMAITEALISEYSDLVRIIASTKHKEYPMVPRDDIEQELWIWFLKHPHKTSEWRALDIKESTKLFTRSLHNAASRFCQYEKARSVGYEITDVFFYQRQVVEELLPSVLNNDWTQEITFDMNSDRKALAPNEGGNLMAMQSDISRAFDMLKEHHQNILIQWNLSGKNSKELAIVLKAPNEKAARMRVTRAIDALIQNLGGHKPYYEADYKAVKIVDKTEKEAD